MSAAEHGAAARTEKAEKAQLERQAEIDDLLWLMSDKRGRRIVWRLLGESGVYQVTFTGDALTSAFREGRRSRGLDLLAAINQHCPERFSEMQKEATNNERRKAKAQ
jgi:hypothetical protein